MLEDERETMSDFSVSAIRSPDQILQEEIADLRRENGELQALIRDLLAEKETWTRQKLEMEDTINTLENEAAAAVKEQFNARLYADKIVAILEKLEEETAKARHHLLISLRPPVANPK